MPRRSGRTTGRNRKASNTNWRRAVSEKPKRLPATRPDAMPRPWTEHRSAAASRKSANASAPSWLVKATTGPNAASRSPPAAAARTSLPATRCSQRANAGTASADRVAATQVARSGGASAAATWYQTGLYQM
jgi:hypothetical protein